MRNVFYRKPSRSGALPEKRQDEILVQGSRVTITRKGLEKSGSWGHAFPPYCSQCLEVATSLAALGQNTAREFPF